MITYRELTHKDYRSIINLTKEIWFDEYPYKEYIKVLYAKGYLYEYLSESSYKMVAVDDNKVIGFIFGRLKKVPLFKIIYYYIRLFFIGLVLLFTKAGRNGLKIEFTTMKVNNKLYKPFKKDYDAQLSLFIVDKNYQGMHIGSTLKDMFEKYAVDNNCKGIYLYTDTYSNYKYYEKNGYIRLNEVDVNFNASNQQEKPKYFLYGKK